MYLGIDDTDSPDGMCTTYLGGLVAQELVVRGCVVNKMRLIRLNPNVPWKTRGNAGVSIEFTGGGEWVADLITEYIEKYAQFTCANTNPGFVLLNEKPPEDFYYKALRTFCTVEEAEERLQELGAVYRGWKNRRGLIGALAAVSAVLPDKTYEYLAYRMPDACGTPRQYDAESFRRSAVETAPHTWDTWDFSADKPVCLPHGKDPVLYGIRGESPEWVEKAVSYLKAEEESFRVIWETNQGTDAHILPYDGEFVEGCSYTYSGTVEAFPVEHRGGHVSVRLSATDCYAFEPTKSFREYVRCLIPGDKVTVYGSYLNGVLHFEKFSLDSAAPLEDRSSPRCPKCGGRMTSAGKGKGYKCRVCSERVREPSYLPR
ncbi:MAG TPA: tRNA(Ile)(2)-agmatinylcytidine synthase, partial [Methanocorpusculum sp.]|nr:tRNA(Ile)(2)-agmatinylcytidine synthase [Methanocorpusculum sp.]